MPTFSGGIIYSASPTSQLEGTRPPCPPVSYAPDRHQDQPTSALCDEQLLVTQGRRTQVGLESVEVQKSPRPAGRRGVDKLRPQ